MTYVYVNMRRRGMVHEERCTYLRGANLARLLPPHYVRMPAQLAPRGRAHCSLCEAKP